MKKAFLIIFIITMVILVGFISIKLNSIHYQKLADERIEKVIELQGANIEDAEIYGDFFSYNSGYWEKLIYFKDDPDIRYEYQYNRYRKKVKVSATYHNMSLDLAHKTSKYLLFNVYFDKKGNVKDIQKR